MNGPGPACLDEGVLVGLLDGALPPAHERRARAHLEECPPCRERLDALRRRDEAVRRWIVRHDPEPPPRAAYDLGARPGSGRWSRGWVAAAAVVVVSGAVLVSPARGLLADGLVRWIDALVFRDEPQETVPLDPVGDVHPGTAFDWDGPELTLTFESPATAGDLTVEPAPDSLVTLWTPGGDVGLTVRPGRVDVENAAVPTGSYRLAVPPSLSVLRVRVPGGGESATPVGGLSSPRMVPLPKGSPSGGDPR